MKLTYWFVCIFLSFQGFHLTHFVYAVTPNSEEEATSQSNEASTSERLRWARPRDFCMRPEYYHPPTHEQQPESFNQPRAGVPFISPELASFCFHLAGIELEERRLQDLEDELVVWPGFPTSGPSEPPISQVPGWPQVNAAQLGNQVDDVRRLPVPRSSTSSRSNFLRLPRENDGTTTKEF